MSDALHSDAENDDVSFWDSHADVLIVTDRFDEVLARFERDRFDVDAQRELAEVLQSPTNLRAIATVGSWRAEDAERQAGAA